MPPTYFQLPIYFSSSSFYHFTPQPVTKSWWSPDTQIQQLFISPHSIQFSSLIQLCLTLCDPMDYSTPGLPVQYQLPEFTQTPVHLVGNAIQPSHPLSSPSPPALNLSQHQGMSQLLASGGQNIGVSASTSVLPMNTQDWSPLGWTGWISLQSERLSRVFSNTTIQKHHFWKYQFKDP